MLLSVTPETDVVRMELTKMIVKMSCYTGLSKLVTRNDGKELSDEEKALRKRIVNLYSAVLLYGMCNFMLLGRQFDAWPAVLARLVGAETHVSVLSRRLAIQQLDDNLMLDGEYRQCLPTKRHSTRVSKKIREQLEACLGEVDPVSGLEQVKSEGGPSSLDLCRWIRSREEYKSVVDWDAETNKHNRASQVLLIGGASGINTTALIDAITRYLLDEANPNEADLNGKYPSQARGDSNHGQRGSDQTSSSEQATISSKKMPWAVSFYLCGRTGHGVENFARVLRGLIYSLIEQQPILITHLMEAQSSAGGHRFDSRNDFTGLTGIFFGLLYDKEFVPSYLVVDGIDECTFDEDRDNLLRFIQATGNLRGKVRWIVSAKVTDYIRGELGKGRNLEYLNLEEASRASMLSATFRRSVDDKVSDLAALMGYQDDTKAEVASIMHEKSQGNTLWAVAACKVLQRVRNQNAAEVVRNMPGQLEELYRYAEAHIATVSGPRDNMSRIFLSAMALVYRPLRVPELSRIVGVPLFVDPVNSIEKCRPLLEVQAGVVSFVDPSARRIFAPTGRHAFLVTRLLEWLSAYFKTVASTARELSSDKDQEQNRKIIINSYGTIHWLGHLVLVRGIASDVKMIHSVATFMRKYFLSWLDVVASSGLHIDAGILMKRVERFLAVSDPNDGNMAR